jgi:hypothetical protein
MAFTAFEVAAFDIASGKHNIGADDLRIYLANAAPNASTHGVKADLAEIATGNGYTGSLALPGASLTRTAGTWSLNLTGDLSVAAAGGSIGPFQHAILFNNTHIDKPLLSWWSYGSAITLLNGESLDLDLPAVLLTGSLAAA